MGSSMSLFLLQLLVIAAVAEEPLRLFSGVGADVSAPDPTEQLFNSVPNMDSRVPSNRAQQKAEPLSLTAGETSASGSTGGEEPLSLFADSTPNPPVSSPPIPSPVMEEEPMSFQSTAATTTGTTARSVGWPGEVNLKVTSAGVEHTLHVPNGVTFEDATDAFLKEKNLEHLMNKKDGIVAKLIEMANQFSQQLKDKGLNPDDYEVREGRVYKRKGVQ